MSENSSYARLPFFSRLSVAELEAVSPLFEKVTYQAGETIFTEGSEGDKLFVIITGVVQISTRIAGSVDKTLITLRDGGLFGELAIISDKFRNAAARAVEATALLGLSKEAWRKILDFHPGAGKKILEFMVEILAGRLQNTTELYRQAVDWGLSISGILELNFHQLISNQVHLVIELGNQKTVAGTLMKAEKGAIGYELLIKTATDEFVIIPYHAVNSIAFAPEKDGKR